MAQSLNDSQRLRKSVLVIIALAITVLFLWMIRQFLMTLLLAAIISGIFHPLFSGLERRFGGRPRLAAAATVGIVLLLFIGPVSGFLGIVAAQAFEVSQMARPWVQNQLARMSELDRIFGQIPALEPLIPYRDQILAKLGELGGHLGSFIVAALTAVARETATFLLLLFVMLYAMFFFLIDGRAVLSKILYYLPLTPSDEELMLDRFLSVSRATIKGTLMIGALQGALGGLGFFFAGIGGAALWGTVMAVLSTLPGIGGALVWIPAVAYLGITGHWTAATLLFAWCAGVVGSVDNFLRPWLVGRDTKMPDLLILLATLGGIVLFGAIGFIVGPIVAALFVTVWDLYGEAFKDVLPAA